jgi:hypothetical protein
MTAPNAKERRQIARHLLEAAFADVPLIPRPNLPEVTAAVTGAVRAPGALAPADEAFLVRLAAEPDLTTVGRRRVRRLLALFGMPEVERRWAAAPPVDRRPLPLEPPTPVLEAAVRVAIDPANATAQDTATLDSWVITKGHTTVPSMADYEAESRGLPPGFDETTFVQAVTARLQELGGNVTAPFIAVVVGRLLLDSNTDPTRSDFKFAVKRAYDVGVEVIPSTPNIPNKKHYESIAQDFRFFRPRQKIRYQELAAVADHVIASAEEEWDITDEASRRSQVDVGFIRYADGTVDTGFTGLDLPPIVSEDASNQEIEPSNVEAVAMVAAAYELEQTGAFDVVDQMVELFMQGMLPVRDDSGGRALNRYYWQAQTRLDASERAAQYARVLGKGPSGRNDPQPNTQFDMQLMRFVSALVRYDNTLQVSQVVNMNTRDRLGSSEQVRKCAQDLAANASLYGWGFTVFAARKLSRQVDTVFDVLGEETLQRAYGVTGPWQLVERVSAVELGSTPAIVQHRTRAQAVKDLLDTLAVYSTELSRSGGVRRFLPNLTDLLGSTGLSSGGTGLGSTVSVEDYERLVTAANNLIAVGGVTDDELARLSTPVASPARGSIPTVGNDTNGFDMASFDQMRQLAQQGQFDQLQRLFANGASPVR